MERPERPVSVDQDAVICDLPYGHWAVVRRTLNRKTAHELREKLWEAGIMPGMPTSSFNATQMQVWEEDWAVRIVKYVRRWSFTDEETGSPLDVNRDAVDQLPDPCYASLCGQLSDLMKGRTAEDAKSPSDNGVGVVRRDEDASIDAPADAPGVHASNGVGSASPA